MNIQRELSKLKPYLREKYGVKKIGVFGSYARGEEKESSDIDILIELEKPIGWEFFYLKDYLEKKLGREIDLVTVNALKPRIRERILREVIYA